MNSAANVPKVERLETTAGAASPVWHRTWEIGLCTVYCAVLTRAGLIQVLVGSMRDPVDLTAFGNLTALISYCVVNIVDCKIELVPGKAVY